MKHACNVLFCASCSQLCILHKQACQTVPEPVLAALQLIHMDLKSKNVLLNGRKDLAKIADVGLSRIIQSTLGGAGSTPFGVGTFEYTAPEILLGRQCNEKVRFC